MVSEAQGQWTVSLSPKKPSDPRDETSLTAFSQRLGRHILIDHSGLGQSRGPSFDASPWQHIRFAIQTLLESVVGYRLRPNELTAKLRQDTALDSDLIPDVLRMCATMGIATVTSDQGGLWYNLAEPLKQNAERRRYLASFSEELLVKSRRIDHLIQHTGTVGSYREDLLRNLLGQILPQRYQVSTGFIENSPRQLDIIIWDAHRYGALFRDGGVVVVPAPSVRAIIEVKTTLGTGSLDEALEILDDVMRVSPPLLPVFKGIFAFESDYAQSKSVAERTRTFYQGTTPDGIIERKHCYLGQGVKSICVPNHHLVRETYSPPKAAAAYPQPCLGWFDTTSLGDVNTAAFIADILTFLDIDLAAKTSQLGLFRPILHDLKPESTLQLFDDDWRPTLTPSELKWTTTAEGAHRYLCKLSRYRTGIIDADELVADTDAS
jgi:hypothetical protein